MNSHDSKLEPNTQPASKEQKKLELLFVGLLVAVICILLLLTREYLVPAADVKPEPGATSMQVEQADGDLEEYLAGK